MTDTSDLRKTIDLLPGDLYVEILKSFRKFGVFGCQIAIIREIDGEVEPLGVSYPMGTHDGERDVVGADIFPLGRSSLFITLVALHKALELKGYDVNTPLKEVLPELDIEGEGLHEVKNCIDILNFKKCSSDEIDGPAETIIEQLTYRDYATFVQEEIFKACNMKCSKFKHGVIWSNGRDLITERASQIGLAKGTYDGEEVYEIASEDDQYGNLTMIMKGHKTKFIVLYRKVDEERHGGKEDFLACLKLRLIEHFSKLGIL
ncbi:uncharacterized protein L199_004046 [Kwoniella botswanensis]|uniref:uncharacterized protein n=1 Tax=Kwoniella botswanensis TaxID=1268659 RepID=UPI00315DCF44